MRAAATSATGAGNTISLFLPFSNLAEPLAGASAHNVFASSFLNLIVDVAPSAAPGAGADVLTRSMFGKPYTVIRAKS